MTEEGQMKWLDEMIKQWKEAMVGEGSFAMTEAIQAGEIGRERTSNNMRLSNYDSKTGLWKGEDGKKYNAIWNAGTKRFDVTEFSTGPVITPNSVGDTTPTGKGNGNGNEETGGTGGSTETLFRYYDYVNKKWVDGAISKEIAKELSKNTLDKAQQNAAIESANALKKLKTKLAEFNSKHIYTGDRTKLEQMIEKKTWPEYLAYIELTKKSPQT
jgi:hypothetical protein